MEICRQTKLLAVSQCYKLFLSISLILLLLLIGDIVVAPDSSVWKTTFLLFGIVTAIGKNIFLF